MFGGAIENSSGKLSVHFIRLLHYYWRRVTATGELAYLSHMNTPNLFCVERIFKRWVCNHGEGGAVLGQDIVMSKETAAIFAFSSHPCSENRVE